VDLRTVDLLTYTVVVVPSLADDADIAPYASARPRWPSICARLLSVVSRCTRHAGSGTTSRGFKDVLIQNLAAWAGASYATAQGPGLVALDGTDLSRRYDWLRNITPLHVGGSGHEGLLAVAPYPARRFAAPRSAPRPAPTWR
jgi:hypothetical protein